MSQLPTIHFGSTIVEYSSNEDLEVLLFSDSDFKSRFGRSFSIEKDYVGVMNGDANANQPSSMHVNYYSGSKNIWVRIPGAKEGNIRLNFIVLLAN